MPLARDHHIVITVIAHFTRRICHLRSNGASNRQSIALAFLAAKAAAHAAHFNADILKSQTQCFGHFVLNFARVLG